MSSEISMRSIYCVVRDLFIYIKQLEQENKELKDRLGEQAYKLAKATEDAQTMNFRSSRLWQRIQDASGYIKLVCEEDDGLSAKSVRRLWKALDTLGV